MPRPDLLSWAPVWHSDPVCESRKSGQRLAHSNLIARSPMTQTSTSTIAPELLDPTLDPPAAISPVELPPFLAARMCHYYMSPAGAIMSGLALLEGPGAQHMREEAMTLIASSAKK